MHDNLKDLIDANQANLERIIGWVGIMDAKAKFVLSLVLVLIGYLAAQLSPFIDAHTRIKIMPPLAVTFIVLLDIAAAACITLFIWVAVIAIRAIRPITARHTGNTSPLFFDTIADMPHEQFKQRMKTLTCAELLDSLIDQTYDNAKVIQQKTRALQKSTTLFFIGLACFLLFSVGRSIIVGIYPAPPTP